MSDSEDPPLSDSKGASAAKPENKSKSDTSGSRAQSPNNGVVSATLPSSVLTIPPSGNTGRRSRSQSPNMLPPELVLKCRSQLGRISSLKQILHKLNATDQSLSVDEVQRINSHVDDVNKTFAKEHSYMETTWPRAHLDHDYVTNDYLADVIDLVFDIRVKLGKLKVNVTATATNHSTQSGRQASKLPDLEIPSFRGNYLEWAAFSELFTSIIIDNADLSNIERLQYLRGCLQGEPLQLIQTLPLTGDSFEPAWNNLTQRYNNKRVMMQAQFDKLLAITPIKNRNATSLNTIIATVRDADLALQPLATPTECWNALLIHQVVRNLDRATREAWETKLGASREFPPKSELETFITTKIRALESVESATTGSTQQVTKPLSGQRTSHSAMQARTQLRPNVQRFGAVVTPPQSQRSQRVQPQCNAINDHHRPVTTATFNKHTLLATAIALVSSSTAVHNVRLLIDAGSELTFVTENFINTLGVQRAPSRISINGIEGSQATRTRGIVTLTVKSIHNNTTIEIQAHILRTLTAILPSFHILQPNWPHLGKLNLADPYYLQPRPIDLIIGADYYGQIIKPNLIKGPPTMPIAQLSIFGWLILGPTNTFDAKPRSSYNVSISDHSNASIRDLLTKFWIQEELPSDEPSRLTSDEQECEDHFLATHSRDSTGRYIVRIPLKSSPSALGNSYNTAHFVLQRNLTKLKRNKEYGELYANFMREYAALNHMIKADTISPNNHSLYYLPHHGILKLDSTSTKLRVVFNGSSPTSTGISVNDLMHTGANLLLNIPDVLLWIRHHKYIFATDITKMYRQIKVHEEDWKLQRILWIDEEFNEVPYNLTTVTYGTRAAPFLAIRTLLQLAEDEGNKYPLAVQSIKHARYVDDIFGGAETQEDLIEIANQLIQMCSAGGFPLAKWQSNTTAFLNSISANDQPQNTTISLDDCNTKILGLRWNSINDEFTFATKAPTHHKLSKRLILSDVAQIFDPLGLLAPVIIRAKMLLQELWLHKLDWDDPLPSQVTSRWIAIREDLTSLARLSIPRWFNTYDDSTVELHGFSDASQLAMAAVIYIAVFSPSTNLKVTSLVCSKTKVAPLKKITIPRLELSAALMLAKLMQHVQANLKLNISNVYLWTDSQVTHTWIKSPAARWKDYVRNRVTQIHELTPNAHWRHVPGTSNPADCASRGISTAQLEQHTLWWTGPPWLSQSSENWPKISTITDTSSAQEVRPGIANVLTTQNPDYHWDLIYKYSSLNKLFTITSVCFRFISRLRQRQPHNTISNSASGIERAQLFWIKATQSAFFHHELKMLKSNNLLPPSHVFSRLTAFIDDQGVIRVGGRIDNAHLNYEGKHPAILPRHSRLSELIVDASHRCTLHGGTQLTLAHVRQNYWIIGGRATIKSHVLRCVVCARQRGIRAHQLMGQLPFSRVTPSLPFSHTGVDYAGPLTLKTWKGRGAKTQKGWICVFVCFSTSAVHIELVTDYSTEGFIATYRRFTSRRGIPHTLYSDCGTNFIGADKTLKVMFTQHTMENQRLSALFVNDNTTWSFNPPASPHMGGKWEAVVKSVKYHLQRTVKTTLLTYEEYATLLTQIEATLNSRPLEPLSDDPDDLAVLTPSHFLLGKSISTLPEPTVEHANLSPRARWQLIQQHLQRFWTQWSSQYLQRMQAISKWHHPANNIKIGSLVLLTDERFPPSKWPLARVLKLHPGSDGLTRVVTIKTATTTLTRPIAKLALLPVSESTSSSTP